jgi:glyoxylase-like metal-dependent hydrolase (beta-lactamase superfamily II)
MQSRLTVRRIDFGYFIRPADETGTGKPRVESLLGYGVERDDGVFLFDTGLGEGDPDADARYRPVRRPLYEALQSAEIRPDQIRWIANCHLHLDHCGGNPAFRGRPVFVQAAELRAARTISDYTLPKLIDFEGASYEELDGEAEILPGVIVIPTPGHTHGHQAIALLGSDGIVVLAGQATNNAFDYTSEQLAWRGRREGHVNDESISYHRWIERLQQLDPKRILFAHDYAVWEP